VDRIEHIVTGDHVQLVVAVPTQHHWHTVSKLHHVLPLTIWTVILCCGAGFAVERYDPSPTVKEREREEFAYLRS
jgi:hypothetical protein